MKDTREHILATSLKLFLQKNFKEVTMNEIVKQTGLSKGAFYHYFSSKEQVFEEVLNHFFASFMDQHFDAFSHDSLKEFCEDLMKDVEKKIINSRTYLMDGKEVGFTINHYFLLFDAIKMLPSYKDKLMAGNESELKAWKKIVRIARKNGEIKTEMTDEQVAKLFIYLTDGFGIHKIMDGGIIQFEKHNQEIKGLVRGLYNLLKA